MLATFVLAAWAEGGGSWQSVLWSPFYAWVRAWHALDKGEWWQAMVVIASAAVPAGLLAGAVLWRARLGLMASGAAGWSPGAPVAFDERQWRRSVRTAAERVRAPGGVPLLTRRGDPVLGAVIRTVGHRPRPVLAIPMARCGPTCWWWGPRGRGRRHPKGSTPRALGERAGLTSCAPVGQALATGSPSSRVCVDDLIHLADQVPLGVLVSLVRRDQPVVVNRHLQLRPGDAEGHPAIV